MAAEDYLAYDFDPREDGGTLNMQFKKASKENARLRMALTGISGSGKTYTALSIGSHLGEKVALIDTERGSAAKYADIFEFDVLELDTFSPDNYIAAVHMAEDAGYDVLIIDSLSHEWAGAGGILELHDKASSRLKDSFRAWGEATPKHNAVLNTILASKCHVIATMRSKSEYSVDKDGGKTTIRKVGMAPVQRDGVEYEFDVVGDLDRDNNLAITKTRCIALLDKVYPKAGKEVAAILSDWLSPNGVSANENSRTEVVVQIRDILKDLNELNDAVEWKATTLDKYTQEMFGVGFEDLGYDNLKKLKLELSERRVALKK